MCVSYLGHMTCMLVFQTTRMLDTEQREDTELRDRFKEQWKREPSDKLTETLRKEVSGLPAHWYSTGYWCVFIGGQIQRYSGQCHSS